MLWEACATRPAMKATALLPPDNVLPPGSREDLLGQRILSC